MPAARLRAAATNEAPSLTAEQRRLAKAWLLEQSAWIVPFETLEHLAKQNPGNEDVQFAYRRASLERQRIMRMGDADLVTAVKARISLLEAIQTSSPDDDRALEVGRRVLGGASKGHAIAYGTPSQKAAEREKWQLEVDRLAAAFPALSWSAITKRVGKAFGKSGRTIDRHTTKPPKS